MLPLIPLSVSACYEYYSSVLSTVAYSAHIFMAVIHSHSHYLTLSGGLALCAALMAGGCDGESAGPRLDHGLTIKTNKAVYSLATDRIARVTLSNRSDDPVYLPMGSYVAYERLVAGQWVDAFEWFTVDGIGRSLPLAAGSTRIDQLELWAYLADSPGTYRFRYWLYADPTLEVLLPLLERVSSRFIVTD